MCWLFFTSCDIDFVWKIDVYNKLVLFLIWTSRKYWSEGRKDFPSQKDSKFITHTWKEQIELTHEIALFKCWIFKSSLLSWFKCMLFYEPCEKVKSIYEHLYAFCKSFGWLVSMRIVKRIQWNDNEKTKQKIKNKKATTMSWMALYCIHIVIIFMSTTQFISSLYLHSSVQYSFWRWSIYLRR